MPKTITTAERKRIEYLLKQAKRHHNELDNILASVVQITGDPDPDYGQSADAVIANLDITTDQLLQRLGIEVKAGKRGRPRKPQLVAA